MNSIILASSSARRQELMRWLGVPFSIVPSEFDEHSIPQSDFEDDEEGYVSTLAACKGLSVLETHPYDLIISSDTIVALDGKIYGKPADLSQARDTLKTLRGKTHTVFTSVFMIDGETQDRRVEVVKSRVTFFHFPDEALEKYIATSEPYDKAGGYALQGQAAKFVEKVEGSSMNVVGFPLLTVRDMLEEFGVQVAVDLEESVFQKTGLKS